MRGLSMCHQAAGRTSLHGSRWLVEQNSPALRPWGSGQRGLQSVTSLLLTQVPVCGRGCCMTMMLALIARLCDRVCHAWLTVVALLTENVVGGVLVISLVVMVI